MVALAPPPLYGAEQKNTGNYPSLSDAERSEAQRLRALASPSQPSGGPLERFALGAPPSRLADRVSEVEADRSKNLAIEILKHPDRADKLVVDYLAERFPGGLQSVPPAERRRLVEFFSQGPAVDGQLSATRVEFPDSRPGVPPHRAILFSVRIDSGLSGNFDSVVGRLSWDREDGERIKSGIRQYPLPWAREQASDVNLSKEQIDKAINERLKVPEVCEVALFLDSSGKRKFPEDPPGPSDDSQEADLLASGVDFADEVSASIVCLALVRKARIAGIDLTRHLELQDPNALACLSQPELQLLEFLLEGSVRCRTLALQLDSGQLCLNGFYPGPGGNCPAFAGPAQ